MIADETGYMPISIWADLIDSIEEDVPDKITEVSVRCFRQKKLSSTGNSVAVPTEESIMCDVNWTNITLHSILPQAPTHTVFCCPDIDNVTLNVWPICTKKRCGKNVTPTPGAQIVRCSSCSSTMLLSKCECGLSAELQLTKDSRNLTLTAFSNVLDEFFHANVRHLYKDDMDSLIEKLLQLDNTDFSYNAKKIVTKMSEHLPKDVSSDASRQ